MLTGGMVGLFSKLLKQQSENSVAGKNIGSTVYFFFLYAQYFSVSVSFTDYTLKKPIITTQTTKYFCSN
jgi:hypothetical protein